MGRAAPSVAGTALSIGRVRPSTGRVARRRTRALLAIDASRRARRRRSGGIAVDGAAGGRRHGACGDRRSEGGRGLDGGDHFDGSDRGASRSARIAPCTTAAFDLGCLAIAIGGDSFGRDGRDERRGIGRRLRGLVSPFGSARGIALAGSSAIDAQTRRPSFRRRLSPRTRAARCSTPLRNRNCHRHGPTSRPCFDCRSR
jgi:hypothetical protein